MRREHICSKCTASYVNRSHLRRHEATHQDTPEYDCPVCTKSFRRRRHTTQCALKTGQSAPAPLQAGRKKRSCDNCARTKLACDREMPCLVCEANRVPCTYNRLRPKRELPLAVEAQPALAGDMRPSSPGSVSLNFHLKFSNVENARRFDIQRILDDVMGTPDEIVEYRELHRCSDFDLSSGIKTCLSVENSLLFPDHPSACSAESQLRTSEPHAAHQRTEGCHQGLSEKIDEAVARFVFSRESYIGTAMGTRETHRIRNLFNVDNFKTFVDTYFKYWHPHPPIIFVPSFHIMEAQDKLLLAIFMAGSICAAPNDFHFEADEYFDIIEEYIFDSDVFQDSAAGSVAGYRIREIEILQAAVILTMLQLDAPRHQARHRARSERLPNIIRALRALGLTNSDGDGRNPSFVAGNTGYALDITENVARLVYCTYIVDCKLVVFYRAPPHLNVGEMTVRMPLNRHTSIVAEPASFGMNASKTETMSLATCIRIILHAIEDEWNLQDFVGLSMFDLFVIICAIHSITSTTRASLLINSTHGIETGLKRWRSIWDANFNVFTEENSTRSFMACAPEIWYLTKIALHHGTYEKLWSISGGTTDTEDMTIFHKVLVALG